MASSIRQFWQKLDGNVHPDDAPVLATHRHSFNLDYPPPAFIGDIDNAPVVILFANGGFDAAVTPTEFPYEEDRREYLDWLHGHRKEPPKRLAPYYLQNSVFPWVKNGTAVILNAIAYRSPKLSQEPENQNVAQLLPSTRLHREWLMNEVLLDARQNRRFIIVHRPAMWKLDRTGFASSMNVAFSPNPASPHLSMEVRQRVAKWLTTIQPRRAGGC